MVLLTVALFVFVFGLAVGSFVNVAVFRYGFSERPSARSRCMACEREIAWYDLIPLVSFAVLRGRCRECGSRLSAQYPVVEFSVGALYLLAFLVVPPVASLWSVAAFGALLVFLATLTGLVAYDIRHTLVPMPFVYTLLGSACAASAFQSMYAASWTPLIDAALGAASLGGFFLLVVLVTRGKGMGAGDAYVAGAIGLLLGFSRGIDAVLIGVWSGTLIALLLLLLSSLSQRTRLFRTRLHVTMKTELPLIPFLAFGLAIALYTAFSPLGLATFLSGSFSALQP